MTLLTLLFACGPQADAPTPSEVPTPTLVATPKEDPADPEDPVVAAMRSRPLAYTKHARCRMDCRKISEGEVEAILQRDGTLDPERSRDDGECPSHALEGTTSDGQQVRIVYAACSDETLVVTAIDLDTDWPCGDC